MRSDSEGAVDASFETFADGAFAAPRSVSVVERLITSHAATQTKAIAPIAPATNAGLGIANCNAGATLVAVAGASVGAGAGAGLWPRSDRGGDVDSLPDRKRASMVSMRRLPSARRSIHCLLASMYFRPPTGSAEWTRSGKIVLCSCSASSISRSTCALSFVAEVNKSNIAPHWAMASTISAWYPLPIGTSREANQHVIP